MVGLAIILIYLIAAVYQEINRKYWDYKGFFGWLYSEMVNDWFEQEQEKARVKNGKNW